MKSYIDYPQKPSEAVYIAGPMNGIPDNNEKAFYSAEERLVGRGYLVFNPLRISRSFIPDEILNTSLAMLDKVMKIEKMLIENCTYIYLLKGWNRSVGAQAELATALKYGCAVLLEEEEEG